MIKSGIILFTVANLPERSGHSEHRETHYQTFILNNEKKLLIIIDPSRDPQTGESFYQPHVGRDIQKTFDKWGYKTEWLDTTNACQMNDRDVFCQTWSLYLQIKYILSGGEQIEIPHMESIRYKLLYDFYRTIVPLICHELNKYYEHIIMTEKEYLTEGIPKGRQEAFRKSILRLGTACEIFKKITLKDLIGTDG